MRRLTIVALAAVSLVALAAFATPANGQRNRPVQEFTRQNLLVATFEPGPGIDSVAADRFADLLRDRLGAALNRGEAQVVRGGAIRVKLEVSGFDPRGVASAATIVQLGHELRADELLLGSIMREPRGVRVDARLVLMRDRRIRQPFAPILAPTPEAAADALTRAVATARVQLPFQRRCENFLREGRSENAIRSAREGVAAFSGGALAQTCLVTALRHTGASASVLLAEARQLLAADSLSAHGLEAAGVSLDSLRQRGEAASMWVRLAATDPSNLKLTERVLWALHASGNSLAAEPLVVRVRAAHPDNLKLLQYQWLIANANESWPLIVNTGEALLERDTLVARDSGFIARLVTAYGRNDQKYLALSLAARSVPVVHSARLYSLYAQLVHGEADSVVSRGLALYPRSADLLALNARELRTQGLIAEALEITRLAVAIDPDLPGGQLTIAQAEFDLGQPDSALATLKRMVAGSQNFPPGADSGFAPAMGSWPGASADDSVAAPVAGPASPPSDSTVGLIAQFALSKGNQLLAAANTTRTEEGFALSASFLELAETLRPSPQSAFLRGVATLGAANAVVQRLSGLPASERCALLGENAVGLPATRAWLEAGRGIAEEAANQYLAYLGKLDAFVSHSLATGCAGA